MTIAPHEIRADTVSHAWIMALTAVDALPRGDAFHLNVHVARPAVEISAVRALVDELLEQEGRQPVDTVRNTVFPAALAASDPEPADLAQRYRQLYPSLRKLDRANNQGTYFGRMVDYPTNGGVDQLSDIVGKLRRSTTGRRTKAMYEMNLDEPGLESRVYRYTNDHRKMEGFPCLSFCSLQLDRDTLHMVAHYRSQYLVERAYGNYLGLGQLLEYVARSAELHTGMLQVVVGHACIERARRAVREMITRAHGALDEWADDTVTMAGP